jgi:putative membrane protein
MAWLRTAAAMIGFGFTIVEFFSHLSQIRDVGQALAPHASTVLGLMLIGTGVISLAIAFTQYRRAVGHLESPRFSPIADEAQSRSPAWVVAVALMFAGLTAFTSIVIRALF